MSRWTADREALAFDPLGIKAGEIVQGEEAVHLVVTTRLPSMPDLWENNLRIVRWGLRDVLLWLNEDPGLPPEAETHMRVIGSVVFVSAAELRRIRRLAESDWSFE